MDLAPAARTALRILAVGARALSAAVDWTSRAAWTHRRVVAALLLRVAWWASVWLAIEAASTMFDVRATMDVDGILTGFGAGLGLCWMVVVFSASKYLRWAGIALGTVHGGLGLVLWTITGGG